jgi:hypothetical protein
MINRKIPPSGRVDKTRRGFFRRVLTESVVLFDEIKGRPQMRLSELDQVEDPVIRKMVPALNMSCSPHIKGDCLLVTDVRTEADKEVCRLDPMEKYIFDCFDGGQNLEDIGRRVAVQFDRDTEEAYGQAKSFFIFLAKQTVCYPTSAHNYPA